MPKLSRGWRVEGRHGNVEWVGDLEAYWEVDLDPMSDDYTPDEISARDLFRMWEKRVSEKYPNGLVPIHWFVESQEHALFKYMPSHSATCPTTRSRTS